MTGEDDFIGCLDGFWVVCQDVFGAESFECEFDGLDVSGVIVDDCDFHKVVSISKL